MKAKKDNVSYVDFSAKKKVFRKIEYQWDEIRRANNHDKFLGCKAVNILSNAIHRLEKEEVITYTHSYLTKHFTRAKYEQNNNILAELKEVLDIKFNRSGTANDKKYRDRFEVRKNKNTDKILENSTLFYSTQKPVEPLINSDSSEGKKLSVVSEKIQTALHIYREEEIEEIAYSYLSSISDVKGIKEEHVHVNNETSSIAALPTLRGSSNDEFLTQPLESKVSESENHVKPVKSRLVITAAMQQGSAPLPTTTLPKTITAEEEQEQLRAHQTRQQDIVSEAKPIGATIFSLLPKLGLEENYTSNTYQKGVEFQPEVEDVPSNNTLRPSLNTEIEEKPKPKTINEIMEEKMAFVPEYGKIMQEAVNMAAIAYEHDVDKWEVKYLVCNLNPELDREAKQLILHGQEFNIRRLKRDYLKLFGEAFRKVLPDYEFKFIEEKK